MPLTTAHPIVRTSRVIGKFAQGSDFYSCTINGQSIQGLFVPTPGGGITLSYTSDMSELMVAGLTIATLAQNHKLMATFDCAYCSGEKTDGIAEMKEALGLGEDPNSFKIQFRVDDQWKINVSDKSPRKYMRAAGGGSAGVNLGDPKNTLRDLFDHNLLLDNNPTVTIGSNDIWSLSLTFRVYLGSDVQDASRQSGLTGEDF